MGLIFKQYRSEGGCESFVLADAMTRKACLIDPRADEVDNYAAFIAAHRLMVGAVVDTHTHADHYSGTHLVAQEFGASVAMGAATKSARANILLKDGQYLELSPGLALRVLETPGHTPDSVSFVVESDWGSVAFTGDTLFIGGSGRTDFPGADARAQYESIYKKLGSLDGKTWVLPGHDYSNLLFSTIGQEKSTNPHWQFKGVDDFVKVKNAELLESGGILSHIVDFNLSAKPVARPRSGAHTMCASICLPKGPALPRESAEQFRDAVARGSSQGHLFIDIREPEEVNRGRIAGTCNIPMSELLMHWDEFKSATLVHLVCQEGKRTQVVTQSFVRLGLTNMIDLEGGYLAWIAAKLPVEK